MTTESQKAWLNALENKLEQLDDPDPDIITKDYYVWTLTNLKGMGKIPKVSFGPYGRDTLIKADIMRNASLILSDDWQKKKADIRKKYGYKPADSFEDRVLARKFNKFSNEYWARVQKALTLLQDAQKRFCKPGQTLADPAKLIIKDFIPGFSQKLTPEAGSKSEKESDYEQKLMEID